MALKDITKLIQKAEMSSTPDAKFLAELEKTIYIENAKETRRPSQSFKPSSMGGCSRNIYYQLIGVDAGTDFASSQGVGIGQSGTDRHERLQNAIMLMPNCQWLDIGEHLKNREHLGTSVIEKVGNETKCFNEILNMRFLCDGLVLFHNRKYIIEIKTETSMKFNKRFEPDPKHLLQAACYSICLGVDEVIFLYENRDLCQKKAYHAVVTDELKQKVLDQIHEVMVHTEKSTLPPKSTVKRDCTYCLYKARCKTDGV